MSGTVRVAHSRQAVKGAKENIKFKGRARALPLNFMRALIFGYLSKSLLSLEGGRVREGMHILYKKVLHNTRLC